LEALQKAAQAVVSGTQANFVLPHVVFEVEPGFVVGARLDPRARSVRRIGARQLENGTVEPFPSRSNVESPDDLREALRGLAQIVGRPIGSAGLLIPDGAVRVDILGFETLPENRKEADTLVRWRMRENLPCAPEDAQLAWQNLQSKGKNIELFVVAVKQSVLVEYEQALDALNGGLALVLPTTAALLPLIPEGEEAGQLLLHLCADWLTAVVLEGMRIRSWRTVQLSSTEPADIAREAGLEAARVAASARDRLQVEIARIHVCDRPRVYPGLMGEIGRLVPGEVIQLAFQQGLGSALSDPEQTVFQDFGAVVAGLISNVSK
jgi:hypothetical protein